MNVLPVKLRPGLFRLFAMPSSTGSPLMAKRTGTFSTPFTARVARPLETMKRTFLRIRSATAAVSPSMYPGE